MDEVNATLDGIHESMDEVNAIQRSIDVPDCRVFLIGPRTFETMDDAVTLTQAIHDNHGFFSWLPGRICFIHGCTILSTSRPFLMRITGRLEQRSTTNRLRNDAQKLLRRAGRGAGAAWYV